MAGKGRKARTVGLDPGGFAIIEQWLAVRIRLGITTRRPVFCTLAGEPLKPAYVRALLPRLAGKAGIDKRGRRFPPGSSGASQGALRRFGLGVPDPKAEQEYPVTWGIY